MTTMPEGSRQALARAEQLADAIASRFRKAVCHFALLDEPKPPPALAALRRVETRIHVATRRYDSVHWTEELETFHTTSSLQRHHTAGTRQNVMKRA
jgi:hypothetical protein